MSDHEEEIRNADEVHRKLRHLNAIVQEAIAGKMDAEKALRLIAEMRTLLPGHVESPRPAEDVRTRPTGGMRVETDEDFAWAAVIDAMDSLVAETESMIEQKKAALKEKLPV